MTPEQKAAFINAQAACLMAEVAGMVAENSVRQSKGFSPAYDEAAFQAVINSSICAHNAALSYLMDDF